MNALTLGRFFLRPLTKISLLAGLGGIAVSPAAAFTTFQDTFSTLNTSTTWTLGAHPTNTTDGSGGQWKPTVSGGKLSAVVGATSSYNRSTVISKRSDFNPFAEALVINLTGLEISGAPGVGSTALNGGANSLYVMVGNTSGGNGTGNAYYQDYLANGLALVVENRWNPFGSQAYTMLSILDNGATKAKTDYILSGQPTDITWTINGATSTWSVDLTGATYNGSSTISGSFTKFTQAGITGGSYLTLGSLNNSAAVAAATGILLDSISVTGASSIPEPGTSALIMAGAGLAFCAVRLARKKR